MVRVDAGFRVSMSMKGSRRRQKRDNSHIWGRNSWFAASMICDDFTPPSYTRARVPEWLALSTPGVFAGRRASRLAVALLAQRCVMNM